MSNKMLNSTKVVEIMQKTGGIDTKAAFLYLNMSGGTLTKVISVLRKTYHHDIAKYTLYDPVTGIRSSFYYFAHEHVKI